MSSRKTRDAIIDYLHQATRGAITGIMHGEIANASCISCINFDEKGELCKLYKMRPPARIIAYACPEYMDNQEIPF
jgi:hypothetical protein